MKTRVVFVLLLLCCFSCHHDGAENVEHSDQEPFTDMVFDEVKWKTRDGADYPYRERMLNDIVHNDTIRGLNKDEITDLLGEPDRSNENYLYYTIAQKRLGLWPLHTKTLVIKFVDYNTIDWIKIHE
jgi:hypothetical protein